MGSLGTGIFGFIFKIMFLMFVLAAALIIPIMLIIYWPFTIPLALGIFLSERFYRHANKTYGLRLPKYFYINVEDFLQTFHEGDAEVTAVQEELEHKKRKALKEVLEMEDASRSIDEQLSHIKTKRKLTSLFTREPTEMSARTAKALEMELGKPRWVQYIDKASKSSNGEWEQLYA